MTLRDQEFGWCPKAWLRYPSFAGPFANNV